MDNIKQISIIFENCDTIRISGEHIEYLRISDINRNIYYSINAGFDMLESKGIEIIINPDANIFEKSLLGDRYIFNRIMDFNDITSIELEYYSDKQNQIFHTNYKTNEEDHLGADNILQETEIDEFGRLHVIIEDD